MSTITKNKKCVHYWICPPPKGATSICVCKKCGEKRVMSNLITTKQISIATNKLRRDHCYWEGEWEGY